MSLGALSAMDKLFRDLAGEVLRLVPPDLESRMGGNLVEGLVETLLEMRDRMREAKAWAEADAIRGRLEELGVAIEDGPLDTTWRLKG